MLAKPLNLFYEIFLSPLTLKGWCNSEQLHYLEIELWKEGFHLKHINIDILVRCMIEPIIFNLVEEVGLAPKCKVLYIIEMLETLWMLFITPLMVHKLPYDRTGALCISSFTFIWIFPPQSSPFHILYLAEK